MNLLISGSTCLGNNFPFPLYCSVRYDIRPPIDWMKITFTTSLESQIQILRVSLIPRKCILYIILCRSYIYLTYSWTVWCVLSLSVSANHLIYMYSSLDSMRALVHSTCISFIDGIYIVVCFLIIYHVIYLYMSSPVQLSRLSYIVYISHLHDSIYLGNKSSHTYIMRVVLSLTLQSRPIHSIHVAASYSYHDVCFIFLITFFRSSDNNKVLFSYISDCEEETIFSLFVIELQFARWMAV